MQPVVIIRTEEHRQSAVRRIGALNLAVNDPWGVYIAPYAKLRSLEQNAAYWRLIGLIRAATGNTKLALHDYFKREVFGITSEIVAGKTVVSIASSAKATKGDFSELIETVQQFISEHGIEESA